MHRFNDQYTVEYRENMKGGKGTVQFEHIWKKNSNEEMRSSCRQFSRMTLQPGAAVGIHSHTGEEEIYYILCRAGEEHSMECIGDEPLVYLAVIPVYPEA